MKHATLDLAARGELAINGMLGSVDREREDREITFLNLLDVHPAYMAHWSSMVSGVQPKYVEALPMLRLMSGSSLLVETEQEFLDAMMRNASDDGLVYDRSSADRPWNTGVFYGAKDWNEDYANIAGNGRLLAGWCYLHQATSQKAWEDLARRTAERLLELAVVEGPYAWYPNPGLGNDFSYPRTSGWTTRKPPGGPTEGVEGATTFYLCQPLRGFAQYYLATGDERFLDLSRRIARFAFQPHFWIDPGRHARRSASAMHPQAAFRAGFFMGHWHGVLAAVRGLLDYALVARDVEVIEWARSCYEYARTQGIAKLGMFPMTVQDSVWNLGTEGCTVADMIGLAVALTDAGYGDYWDDVEQYARNGLISAQADDPDELARVSLEGPERPPGSPWGGAFDGRFSGDNKGALPGQEITDRVVERSLGAFGHMSGLRYLTPMLMHCCTANCSQALYYAWEGIVRNSGRAATVTMWLDRRSPWVDVSSALPHDGLLTVQNKGMERISVRKPAWAERASVRCAIDGEAVPAEWSGNRIVFAGLRGAERIEIRTPVPPVTGRYVLTALNNQDVNAGVYDCEFIGNTAVSVTRIEAGADTIERPWYRLWRGGTARGALSASAAQSLGKAAGRPGYVHPERLVTWAATR